MKFEITNDGKIKLHLPNGQILEQDLANNIWAVPMILSLGRMQEQIGETNKLLTQLIMNTARMPH